MAATLPQHAHPSRWSRRSCASRSRRNRTSSSKTFWPASRGRRLRSSYRFTSRRSRFAATTAARTHLLVPCAHTHTTCQATWWGPRRRHCHLRQCVNNSVCQRVAASAAGRNACALFALPRTKTGSSRPWPRSSTCTRHRSTSTNLRLSAWCPL